MDKIRFIGQCILWQGLEPPRTRWDQLVRLLYILIAGFLSFCFYSLIWGSSVLSPLVQGFLILYVIVSLLTFGAIRSYLLEEESLGSFFYWLLDWPLSLVGIFFLLSKRKKIEALRQETDKKS